MSLEFIKNNLEDFSKKLTSREKIAFSILIESSSNKINELCSISPEKILSHSEKLYYDHLIQDDVDVVNKINHDLVMIMKATRLCNLRCVYCHSWRSGPNQVMQFSVLARAIRDSVHPDGVRRVQFVWHGGETTLLPIEYFKKAIWLQQHFKNNQVNIHNVIQTNGTLLSDEWTRFLKDYKFDVGISLDGPPEINDTRRLDKAQKPTSHLVENGIKKLVEYQIAHGILIVIDKEVIAIGIRRLLDYFVEIGVSKIGILNALPENTAEGEPLKGSYLPWRDFVNYMVELFLIWQTEYRDKLIIRELDNLFYSLATKRQPSLCYFKGNCMGRYLTIDPNGDIHACDKYIDDKEFFFGNLFKDKSLSQILNHSIQLKESISVQSRAIEKMKSCRWFKVCHGSCPHDRRLNERYSPGFDGTCCGLSPLLDVMQTALDKQ
jgi:uncharacterized protein